MEDAYLWRPEREDLYSAAEINFWNSWNTFFSPRNLATEHPDSYFSQRSQSSTRTEPHRNLFDEKLFESASIAFQDLFEGEDGFLRRNSSSSLLFTHQIRNSTLFTVAIGGTDVSCSPRLSPTNMVFVYDPSNDAQLMDVANGNVGNMPDPSDVQPGQMTVHPAFSLGTWIRALGSAVLRVFRPSEVEVSTCTEDDGNVGNPPDSRSSPNSLRLALSTLKDNCGNVKQELSRLARDYNPMLSILQVVVSVVDYGVTGLVRIWH